MKVEKFIDEGYGLRLNPVWINIHAMELLENYKSTQKYIDEYYDSFDVL
jgi:hypothetical protein